MFKVDHSKLIRNHRRAQQAFARFGDAMIETVEMAVRDEKQSHRYRNRTRNAERSTKATSFNNGDEAFVRAEFSVPYAIHLVRGGWSNFHDNMKHAQRLVRRAAAKLKRFMV